MTGRATDEVTHRLRSRDLSVQAAGPGQFNAACPAHDDEHESLRVGTGASGALLNCHAGCDFKDVIAALGMEPRELFDDFYDAAPVLPRRTSGGFDPVLWKAVDISDWKGYASPSRAHGAPPAAQDGPADHRSTSDLTDNIVSHERPHMVLPYSEEKIRADHADLMADESLLTGLLEARGWTREGLAACGDLVSQDGFEHPHICVVQRDEHGAVLNVVTYNPDTAERPGGLPTVSGIQHQPRLLWPRPEDYDLGETLILVEGEADAITGVVLGLPVVGVPGAGTWKAEWTPRFAGRTVVVIPDNDEPGRKLAAVVVAALAGVAAAVLVHELDHRGVSGFDLTDALVRDGAEAVRGELELSAARMTVVADDRHDGHDGEDPATEGQDDGRRHPPTLVGTTTTITSGPQIEDGAGSSSSSSKQEEATVTTMTPAIAWEDDEQDLFVPMGVFLKDVPEPEWIWDGYLAVGAVTLITSPPKAGKSTLMFTLLEAMRHGGEVAGRRVSKERVAYMTEEGKFTIDSKVKAHLSSDEHLSIVSKRGDGVRGRTWEQVIKKAARQVVRQGIRVVVVDTWDKWTDLDGEQANQAGAVVSKVSPLLALAELGICVVVVHHDRKSGGKNGHQVAGSTALPGAVDVIVNVERESDRQDDTRRIFLAVGRFGEHTPAKITARLENGEYKRVEDGLPPTASAELRQADDDVAKLKAHGIPITAKDFGPMIDRKEKAAKARLDKLVELGFAEPVGGTSKVDPTRYRYAQPGNGAPVRRHVQPKLDLVAESRLETPRLPSMLATCGYHVPMVGKLAGGARRRSAERCPSPWELVLAASAGAQPDAAAVELDPFAVPEYGVQPGRGGRSKLGLAS
jgi:hypothetical protein